MGIRLITRRGKVALRFEAVNHLKVRSCLIDGEAVCCDERGLATFQLLRTGGTSRKRSSTPSTCWS